MGRRCFFTTRWAFRSDSNRRAHIGISGFLTDWESVAVHLRLAEMRIKEIREVAIEQRTREMLTAWKSAYVRDATYRKLGEVLVKLTRTDFAFKVFKLGECLTQSH